ncbi:XrtN system VIT domain-containing protein [Desertivirga brevis]|uniref:XrtN system VIT domain-containing protein n=1 Tax=Desertivirga brevis TaxID=2810310 RepID=UPI001A9674A5|nr:XrtN system VIT domain-containing protein [Pedobacter sp. SYSU D00873]
MKKLITNLQQDLITSTGIWMIIFSSLILLASTLIEMKNPEGHHGMFFLSYVITVIYTIIVFGTALNRYRWKLSKSKIEYTVLMLILWFVSAFVLNKVMNVFDDSVLWLVVLLVLSCIALIAALFLDLQPSLLKHLNHFVLGIALILFSYFAFSLIPLYLISVPASIGLGISLHSFIPLCLTIVTLTICCRNVKRDRKIIYSIAAGLIFSISVIAIFTYNWFSINNTISKVSNRNILAEGKLPNWVVISQSIPKGLITERNLKSDLVYRTIDMDGSWLWGGFMNKTFDEKQQHDPLVVLASLFAGKSQLDQKERIKILESLYDARHQAQERLWSGDKLETRNVISNVRLIPEYRIAYTEKILTITNRSTSMWNRNQEAVYTFHLPEGAVVSSLSLWIAGKEEKGYLTTKAKADSAYRQIVGVEQHDPSVIHWQEGNTVSVRVFPCSIEEDRKFKIGVTSPLKKAGSELVYENIYFDGPSASDATETLRISSSKPLPEPLIPDGSELVSKNAYQLDRDYKPDWILQFPASPLSSQGFSFNNKAYQISEAKVNQYSFSPKHIYLDINGSWSKKEYLELWEHIKMRKVYVFDEKLLQLDESNVDLEFQRLSKLNFSLFPLYKIDDPKTSLLISKGNGPSPNLSDLKDSEFARKMGKYLSSSGKIHLYALEGQISPYLKTLKELRVFDFHAGQLTDLLNNVSTNTFESTAEDSTSTTIDPAKISIRQTSGNLKSNAPDHLLRLYAYNHIMKEVAGGYFKNDFIQPETIAEAEQANIVTPVSSLIVLETQKDYERFGIEESKNSLKNASMKSSGAVPEPHEWMLILITGAVVIYFLRNRQQTKSVA